MTDGRLLLPAAASWVAASIVTVALRSVPDLSARHALSARVLLLTASVVGLGLLVLAVGAVVGRQVRLRRRLLANLAIATSGLVLGAVSAAAHGAALTPDLFTTWVDARATASVQGVVVTESVLRTPTGAGWHGGDRRELRMATSRISARGAVIDVDLPVLVRLAGDASAPGVGSEVVFSGRLAPASPQADVAATVTVDSRAQPGLVRPPGPIDAVAGAMRTGLRRSLEGTAADAGALVAGLAIGDESGQSPQLRLQMRTSGLSHLTAVSGGNVSVIVVAVLALAAALRLPIVARVSVSLVSLAGFVILVGPAPSVIRAATMAGLVLVGLIVGGRRAGPSVLAAATIVLVVLAPGLTVSWGFALSAGATAGVILLSGPIASRLQRWRATVRLPPAVRDGLAVTLAAQVATCPFLVAMGASVGWVSVPANLLAMPVVAPVTVLGLLAALVSPVAPVVAVLLAHLAAWPAGWIAAVAATCSELPGARLPLPTGWVGVAILAAVLPAALVVRLLVRRTYPSGLPAPVRVGAGGLAALIIVGGFVAPPDRRSWPPADWFMIMCDVGQGDGLLLRARDGEAVVVDVGPDPEAMHRCLDDARISAVPAVVLTHFHADHVGGLAGVLRDREVGAVLATPIRDPPAEATHVDELIADHGLTVQAITAGDSRAIGAVSWRAVWPRRVIRSGSVPNNASVVLIVHVDGHALLLMGDVEPEAQTALAPDVAGRAYDVVKVPHHGSRYQDPLLSRWAPTGIALVSVGADNDYGHPADSTLAAWRATGAVVVRTDLNGDVAVVDDGSRVGVVVRHGMLPSS